MSSKSMRNISKILIVFSFFLFSLASYIRLEEKRLASQLETVSSETESEQVSIEIPNDEPTTSEVVDDNKSKDDTSKTEDTKTNNTKTKRPSTKKETTNNTVTKVSTNDDLRNSIEEKYHIDIKFGSETDGYTVGGMTASSMSDSLKITTALNSLNSALSAYPVGMFDEIGASYPLTIYLIDKYSISNVTGATDSTSRNVKMSIATSFPFNDTFHHETYHYMELYMLNRGMSYSSWADLNPTNFKYGSVNDSLSYSITFSGNSYFVNNYAQSSEEEDRASTFEYMMASSKASCLNNGNPIYKKAKYMADTMDFFIDACSSKTTERWERFL